MSAMPDQPPRAADVPEAIRAAVETHGNAEHNFGIVSAEGTGGMMGWEKARTARIDARRNLYAAIATALREAKEQGAADTARLERLAELLDVAPSMRLFHGKWEEGEMISIAQSWPHNKDWQSEPHSSTLEALRAAIDATRALYGEAES